MKRFLNGLLVALLGIILIASPVLAISNPDDITIFSQRVFQNVYEAGDIMFVLFYDVAYAVPPTEAASSAFLFNLYGTDGTTLLYSRGINYYQENIQTIYLNATAAAALTWGNTYVIKLTGNPAMFASLTENINLITKTLASTDWISGSLITTPNLLYTYLAGVMVSMNTAGIPIMVSTSEGNKLNLLGRTYFLAAIPGLDAIIPNLFQSTSSDIPIIHDTPTGALASELNITTKMGAAIAGAFTGIGNWLGITGTMASGIFIMVVCMLVMFLVYKFSGSTLAALILCIPFLLIGAWSGFIPLAILYVVTIIVVGYMLYHVWLTRV